jgi:hypothetical protein
LHGVNTPQGSLLKAIHGVSPFLPSEVSSSYVFLQVVLSFSRGVHSPTTTSAPSLRPACPEQFPNKFSVSPGYHNHPKFFLLPPPLTLGAITPSVAGAPTYPALTPYTSSFSVSEGSTSPQGPIPVSSQSAGSSDYLFRDPPSENLI